MTLRDASKEVGIAAATLMRIENGRVPDIATFGKVCSWLEIDAANFIEFKKTSRKADDNHPLKQSVQISAHLRADQTPRPETIDALSKMILIALQRQENAEIAIDDDV